MKAKVSINRASDETVRIVFRDCESGIEFAECAMSMESFGFAITGLSEQDAELKVFGLEYVGKKCVTEKRSIQCPLSTYDRKSMREWLQKNAQEPGWILNDYLGSQNSVVAKGGKTILNYSVTKYI